MSDSEIENIIYQIEQIDEYIISKFEESSNNDIKYKPIYHAGDRCLEVDISNIEVHAKTPYLAYMKLMKYIYAKRIKNRRNKSKKNIEVSPYDDICENDLLINVMEDDNYDEVFTFKFLKDLDEETFEELLDDLNKIYTSDGNGVLWFEKVREPKIIQ